MLYQSNLSRLVLGVGLIPLGVHATDHARAVFVLRVKADSADPDTFEAALLTDARRLRKRVSAQVAAS